MNNYKLIGVGLFVFAIIMAFVGYKFLIYPEISGMGIDFNRSAAQRNIPQRSILGNVTSMSYTNGTLNMSGWACENGSTNSLVVKIYKDAQVELLGQVQTGSAAPSYVQSKCNASGNFGFSFSKAIAISDFSPNIHIYVSGQKIYPKEDLVDLVSPDGIQKITFYKPWGAIAVFFGLANQPSSNVLDNVQPIGVQYQSAVRTFSKFFEGCAWNDTCQGNIRVPNMCGNNSDAYSGYNPTQGGGVNNGSPSSIVLEKNTNGNIIGAYTLTRGRLWRGAWQGKYSACPIASDALSNVIFYHHYKFIPTGNTYALKDEITVYNYDNFNIDRAGETPVLFVGRGKLDFFSNAPQNVYSRLFSSDGSEVTNFVSSPENPTKLIAAFTSPYKWATYQTNNMDYGVAIYFADGTQSIKSSMFTSFTPAAVRNIANMNNLLIPAGGSASTNVYLALGSLQTVRNIMSQIAGGPRR